jgi:hypothetical protein
LRLGEQDYFYVNSRHVGRVYQEGENDFEAGWKNYGGSKVWPAPQGWSEDTQWPGPPDPILDGGPYRAKIIEEDPGSMAVLLESADDEYTGLRHSREIRPVRGSATVEIRHRMRNTSLRPARWAIWQVTQQAARGRLSVTVPLKRYRKIYGDEIYRNSGVFSEGKLWRLSYFNQVAEFVINPESGWLATSHGDLYAASVETFPVSHDVTSADGGPLEIWINGKATFTIHGDKVNLEEDSNGYDPYIETEILNPLVELEPGQQFTLRAYWHCCVTNGGSIVGMNSIAAIERPLVAEVERGSVRLKGSFCLSRPGILEFVHVHRSGKTGSVRVVGPAGPSVACSIDESIPLKSGLFRVALRLRDAEGRLLGTTDVAEIGGEGISFF